MIICCELRTLNRNNNCLVPNENGNAFIELHRSLLEE